VEPVLGAKIGGLLDDEEIERDHDVDALDGEIARAGVAFLRRATR